MKRLSKLLLALFIACSITGCSQSTEVVDATYEIYIAGYDWGCGPVLRESAFTGT